MLLLILCWLHGGVDLPRVQHVDLIELNHYQSDNCQMGFTQLIFWEWSADYRRYHVVGWTFPTNLKSIPQRSGGVFVCTLKYSERLYRVQAPLFRETETNFDPERRNLRLFPESMRAGMIWAKPTDGARP